MTPPFRARLTARFVVVLVLAAATTATPVRASAVGLAIAQQTDIAVYQHYLEDLLFTHLGDNRGFGPEHDAALSNIRATLASFGLPVAFEPFVYQGTTYHNCVATQVGLDHPDEIIVVGAHFDTVNNPGADDNGTGTAMVMEAARVLSRHRASRTIKYVLFDREEQGRHGSIAFVNDHAGENIVMAVTADMVGHDSGAYGMDVYGKTTSGTVVNGVANAITTYGGALNPFVNLGNYSFSDHWSFESAGIPACVIIERCYLCNSFYHTQNDAVDMPDYITYPMLADLLRSVVGYLVDEVGVTVWGDATGDGAVDVDDLVQVILDWGACPEPPQPCAGDVNRDGSVDVDDLVLVILSWN